MKKYVFSVIAAMLIVPTIIGIRTIEEPEYCAICDSIPHHAPCIVNLATGTIGELSVYEPHPAKVAELNEYQQGGTFSFLHIGGLWGYRDTANWETHISIPLCKTEYRKELFCYSCRERLKGNVALGFALLDMQMPEEASVFSIKPGEILEMRCYQIEIHKVVDAVEIVVHGNLKIIDGRIRYY